MKVADRDRQDRSRVLHSCSWQWENAAAAGGSHRCRWPAPKFSGRCLQQVVVLKRLDLTGHLLRDMSKGCEGGPVAKWM